MRAWTTMLIGIAAAGCDMGDMGDLVAVVQVEALLRENTCGDAAGGIPERTTLRVELYERDGTLTWVGSQGTFRASIDHEGNFAYRVSERATLRQEEPGFDEVRAACIVERSEEIVGRLVRGTGSSTDAGDAGDAGDDADAEDGTAGDADVPRGPC
ncbi:MAG: hypothetical protein QME96_16105, partial [Myxococcota bacterium]|nr:hypothetical protein [Myxococcota bacterium]